MSWLGDAWFKQPVKLLVEAPKHLQFRRDGDHQRQVLPVLIPELYFFAHDEILMLPDEGRLLLLAHALTSLPLVLGFLTGPTPAFLAAFLALAFELIFDRSHPIENELVDLFDDVEHTELMLQVLPVTLQTVFVEGRAVGNGHLHVKPTIFKRL